MELYLVLMDCILFVIMKLYFEFMKMYFAFYDDVFYICEIVVCIYANLFCTFENVFYICETAFHIYAYNCIRSMVLTQDVFSIQLRGGPLTVAGRTLARGLFSFRWA